MASPASGTNLNLLYRHCTYRFIFFFFAVYFTVNLLTSSIVCDNHQPLEMNSNSSNELFCSYQTIEQHTPNKPLMAQIHSYSIKAYIRFVNSVGTILLVQFLLHFATNRVMNVLNWLHLRLCQLAKPVIDQTNNKFDQLNSMYHLLKQNKFWFMAIDFLLDLVPLLSIVLACGLIDQALDGHFWCYGLSANTDHNPFPPNSTCVLMKATFPDAQSTRCMLRFHLLHKIIFTFLWLWFAFFLVTFTCRLVATLNDALRGKYMERVFVENVKQVHGLSVAQLVAANLENNHFRQWLKGPKVNTSDRSFPYKLLVDEEAL